jgi:hypothetical protein
MYPHRIRLRGPWEYWPLTAAKAGAPLPAPGHMTMPCRWREGGLGDFAGTVRFVRRFGLPRQIDSHERLWLTFAGIADRAGIWVNGRLLGHQEGAAESFEIEVTDLLEARNELTLEVTASGGHGGLWGEVALEVRASAYLRGLRLWATRSEDAAQLHVAGQVAGVADRPLDLYALLHGSTVAYTTVTAGQPFLLDSEPLAGDRWQRPGPAEVRVELVNGGVVWYRDDRSFDFASGFSEKTG